MSRHWRRLLAFVPTRKAAVVLFAVALVVFWFQALGWPMDTVNALTKAVPHGSARRVRDHRLAIEGVLGSGALVDRLLEAVEDLEGCPRHLGQHSGGMVLSRRPLRHFTPVQVSANGVKVVQFDKDDVEALGLVKLDVLGLRMLATLSEATELLARNEGTSPDIAKLPLDPFDEMLLEQCV